MKKVVYTVSQLSLSGRGKKMWKHGDVVTESDFPENFNQLIKEGRIKVEESETEETPLFIFVDSENNQRPIFTVEDITKAELQAYLLALEVAFKPSEKEAALFAKAVEASKKGE